MRSIGFAALLIALLLAACGPTPTATPAPTNTPVVTAEVIPDAELAQTVPLPSEGTLTYVDRSGTPAAPEQPFTFNTIDFSQLVRTDEDYLVVVEFQLDSSGAIRRNGVSGTVTPDEVAEISRLLDQIRIYDIIGTFTDPNLREGGFRYSVSVDGPLGGTTLDAQDGLMPAEIQTLMLRLLRVGENLDAPTEEATTAVEPGA